MHKEKKKKKFRLANGEDADRFHVPFLVTSYTVQLNRKHGFTGEKEIRLARINKCARCREACFA